jgi:glyoxylase-like metal-dependent hydrolase (beta-lactamase superfamily II)/rhodanese-related sulfurtransferase
MVFRQIRSTDGTGTLSYLVGDETTAEAAVIDPNKEDTRAILALADSLKLRITEVIDTHTHADHVSGAGELKARTGARLTMHEATVDKWKVLDQGDAFGIGDILRANATHEVDRYVRHGDAITVGTLAFTVLHTPGHTDNHISLLLGDRLFTGDLLLIGQAGRSDLPGGNTRDQYESLTRHVLPLPDETRIYPGHDYEEKEYALLGNERSANPFLHPRTLEEYLAFVADFFPPLAEAVGDGPVILQCGTHRVSTSAEGFRSIGAAELAQMIKKNSSLLLLDVREPFELAAFGAIPGVTNIPSSEITRRRVELPGESERPIAVICQSGNRSFEVSHYLVQQGYRKVYNLEGGTFAWLMNGQEVVRPGQNAKGGR